ncbi:MAG: hypothetical protein M3M98_01950 [Nitrospirota bacterium]|nr:hypothetical protein [Nitrospirota bacterium]
MSRKKNSFVGLAALLAGIYLILAVFSVACAVEHLEPQAPEHHHGGTVPHSTFCAWACQANPTSDAGPSAVAPHPFLMVAPFVERDHTVLACGPGFPTASRAPPVQS